MALAELLGISPGVTAVIGSGGKTTLVRVLAGELAARGRTVVLCTTTHIRPFEDVLNLLSPTAEELTRALSAHGVVCAGAVEAASGKLIASELPMALLASLADYVLVEADGSAGLPLKAHAPHEPVIPPEAGQTVCVVGLSGLGLPIRQVCHRPERYALLAGVPMDEAVTPELAGRVLRAEGLAQRYFLNQADTPERWEWARRLAEETGCPAVAGALRKGVYVSCW